MHCDHVHTDSSCLDLVCVVVQIVQNQEQEAAEMAEQIQELEGDRQQLQVANEDLDLAEDRVSLCFLSCLPTSCSACHAYQHINTRSSTVAARRPR